MKTKKVKAYNPIYYKDHIIGRIEGVSINGYDINVHVRLTHCYNCGKHLQHCPGIGQFCPNRKCEVVDGVGRFSLKEIY